MSRPGCASATPPESNATTTSDTERNNGNRSCLGFYLNATRTTGAAWDIPGEPYLLSLAEVFGDGRRFQLGPREALGTETCAPGASSPPGSLLLPTPFPGIADALLANYIADYDETFLFEHCPSLYQISGRLVLLTGDSPARVSSQRHWVQTHLGSLAKRTLVIGVSGLFAQRGTVQGFRTISSQRHGPSAGGVHHSKFMVLKLQDDRVRLVIHTSNDIAYDWFHKCQGIFAIDLPLRQTGDLPPINAFGSDLQQYLQAYVQAAERVMYRTGERSTLYGTMIAPEDAAGFIEAMTYFRRLLASCDYASTEGIRLVSSVPGWHQISYPTTVHQASRAMLRPRCAYGHIRLANLLAALDDTSDQEQSKRALVLVLQCSSLSSIDVACTGSGKGAQRRYWLTEEFLVSLLRNLGLSWPEQHATSVRIHLVWPTTAQVGSSHLGFDSGIGLIARAESVQGPLLRPFLTRWNANWCHRARVMPHIKTISCWDAQTGDCLYCYLGSANMTPAAWGIIQNSGQKLRCLNWELGVLFTGSPSAKKKISTKLRHWMGCSKATTSLEERSRLLCLPLPYTIEDCAANRYEDTVDQPWSSDTQST
jgi:hypothetical protein